jgi:hypothetical protein
MCRAIIFQLQEANSLEVESKEDWNLKQSLKEKSQQWVELLTSVKYTGVCRYHNGQVSPHNVSNQRLPENKED